MSEETKQIRHDEWREHVEEDRQQTRDIHSLKIAIFGDQEKPETLRYALHPTMLRINAFIDVWKWIGALFVGIGITAPVWIPLIKTIVHELAR